MEVLCVHGVPEFRRLGEIFVEISPLLGHHRPKLMSGERSTPGGPLSLFFSGAQNRVQGFLS